MRKIWLLAVLVTSACSHDQSGKSVTLRTPEDFRTADTEMLCADYGVRGGGAGEARTELVRRGVFTPAEMAAIDAHKLLVGLSECGVLAALGTAPNRVTSTTDNATGKVIQVDYLYRCDRFPAPICPATNVTMRDGRVVYWGPSS